MTLEQLNFCLDTVKKGDELYIAYEENFVRKEYACPKLVTHQDISYIVELLTIPKKARRCIPYDFYIYEEAPVLLRKHCDKYYDIHGNCVTVW